MVGSKFSFTLTFVGQDKVAHIKAIRAATGLPLVAAKALVDEAWASDLPSELEGATYPKLVIMRDDQLGRLLAHGHIISGFASCSSDPGPCIAISNVKEIEGEHNICDLSGA
jgi:hypothetical protein